MLQLGVDKLHGVQILAATLHGNNDVKEGWGAWVSQEQQWPEQQ